MRTTIICLALVASVCALQSSCSGSKQVYQGQAQGYNRQSQVTAPVVRQKREVEECIKLAEKETDKYRAVGTSISYQEEYAMQNAEANAVTAMVQRMETAVEGARLLYNKTSGSNKKQMSEGSIESIVRQDLKGKCMNYRVIKSNLYDLSDGTVQCYVCIELRDTKDGMLSAVEDALKKNEVISVDEDRKKFMELIKGNLEQDK